MQTDTLSQTFGALSDPTRRSMLERLSRGEASVNELAEPFKLSLPAVSKHLKVLEKAGLISRGRRAQWRPCHLETRPMEAAQEWMDDFRKEWEQRFDRLETYLKTIQENQNKEGTNL